MQLLSIELSGFKSFGKKTTLSLEEAVTAIVGPNGSGKSNVAEGFRFVLGEQSMKSMRGKSGTDLIFKGSSKTPALSKASVTLTFDNKRKPIHRLEDVLGGSFDEIVISREIYADGTNEYCINGSKVRLKDITELLIVSNMGGSGHQIISQGEADRILYASDRERKEMVEDALGLKLYQWRIKESERKLERTNNNLREAEISRREIAPHLHFLKKQVEKINKAAEFRSELKELYRIYLAREEKEIREEENLYAYKDSRALRKEYEKTEHEIAYLQTSLKKAKESHTDLTHIVRLEEEVKNTRDAKDLEMRKEGRLDAEISFAEHTLQVHREKIEKLVKNELSVSVSKKEAETLASEMEENITQAIWRAEKHEYKEVGTILSVMKSRIIEWKKLVSGSLAGTADFDLLQKELEVLNRKLEDLKNERKTLEVRVNELANKEQHAQKKLEDSRGSIVSHKESTLLQEKKLFELSAHHHELKSAIDLAELKENYLKERKERFENELKEGSVLIGQVILEYKNAPLTDSGTPQEELRRKIERIKIRLEDVGIANVDEISKEYGDVKGRDEFLTSEMEDLKKSKESLDALIFDLKEKLAIEFENGIEKINKHFEKFFREMFSGGDASLAVIKKEKRIRKSSDEDEEMSLAIEEEPELEEGIEVRVSLPQKKVRDLAMLSGGERALTSIALLFALSQVNPPPFLILDETDAALDEANARKYGLMLKTLSEKTKLVVITHNRETMSQADVLYGVTVGGDGTSKVLSIKLMEAAEYAK